MKEILGDVQVPAGCVANDVGGVRTCIRSLAPTANTPGSGVAPDGARGELRNLLATAAGLAATRPLDAAVLYQRARAICQTERLAQDEVTVVMALGWICAAVGAREQAAHAYGEAAVLAERECLWAHACEAWIEAGEHRPAGDPAGAALAFRSAAGAAKLAGLVVHRIEALRLAGTALLALGREDEAMLVWEEAVDFDFLSHVQRCDWLDFVAEELAELLRRHGLMGSAEAVEAVIAKLRPEAEHETEGTLSP